MPLTPEEVRHNARLARVGLSDDEVSRFQSQLSLILDYFQRLQEVDTENVPPTAHTLAMHNVMRDDEPHPSSTRRRCWPTPPSARATTSASAPSWNEVRGPGVHGFMNTLYGAAHFTARG